MNVKFKDEYAMVHPIYVRQQLLRKDGGADARTYTQTYNNLNIYQKNQNSATGGKKITTAPLQHRDTHSQG